MLKKILLATDGSELSRKAVTQAVDFAASYGSKIVGLSISEIFPSLIVAKLGTDYDLQGIEDEIFRQSKLNTDFIAELAKNTGAACEVHTMHPYEEILRVATEYGCDSIFMASYGCNGPDKLMQGSETMKVLAYSKIPVLVFK